MLFSLTPANWFAYYEISGGDKGSSAANDVDACGFELLEVFPQQPGVCSCSMSLLILRFEHSNLSRKCYIYILVYFSIFHVPKIMSRYDSWFMIILLC